MRFRELQVGQKFDFIGPDRMLNSFYSQCEKTGARKYRWLNTIRCSQSPSEYLETRVGSINVEVYHVEAVQLSGIQIKASGGCRAISGTCKARSGECFTLALPGMPCR